MRRRITGTMLGVMLVALSFASTGFAQLVCNGTTFDDVDEGAVGLAFCHYIERFATLGITGGCSVTPPLYCPGTSVTRGQMAVFLTSALDMVPSLISEGPCTEGQVLKKTATGYTCSDDLLGGGTPSSTVSALDGTSTAGTSSEYSRGDHEHGIGTGVITSAHILDGTITNADISASAAIDYSKVSGVASSTHNHDATYVNEGQADSITSAMIVNGTIRFVDIGQGGCATGQVMKWDGSAWACGSDNIGAGDITGVTVGMGLAGGGASGDVAISVQVPLSLEGTSSSIGILSGTNDAYNGIGVYGIANGSSGHGVFGYGMGSSGKGVSGYALATGSAENYGGYFSSAGNSGRGVYGEATATGAVGNFGGYFRAAGNIGHGVHGEATATGSVVNYGGYFNAAGDSGRGVYAEATGNNGIGVLGYATATGGATNYGGYFIASGSNGRGVVAQVVNSTSGIGVNGEAGGSTGVGVRGSGGQYDFYAAGPGQDYGTASSIRWKKNIVEIDQALDKVINLRGVYFDWDEEHGGQHDMGFIAEEVGKVVPEIVGFELDGVYASGVDYGAITPMLVQAIKEQQKQIEQLKAQIEELKKRIEQ